MRIIQAILIGLFVTFLVRPAAAWDPVGDLMNPGRILRNIERETGNVGREIDRWRLEGQANAGAPLFEAWLRQSRNDASRGSMPIPPQILAEVEGFFSPEFLAGVRYKVGDPGVFNLANLSIRYGDAAAVTLIDVIVFRSNDDAQTDVRLWVHELHHVRQFREWGVRDFAIRYLRSWNSVENEAHAAENAFDQWREARMRPPPSPVQPPFWGVPGQIVEATVCETPFGMCEMRPGFRAGLPCICPTWNGPIQGMAR